MGPASSFPLGTQTSRTLPGSFVLVNDGSFGLPHPVCDMGPDMPFDIMGSKRASGSGLSDGNHLQAEHAVTASGQPASVRLLRSESYLIVITFLLASDEPPM